MAQRKYITSHAERKRKANEFIKNSPNKISIFDREALIETYLLEDICYKYGCKAKETQELIDNKKLHSRQGLAALEANYRKFSSIAHLFSVSADICKALIQNEKYSDVWRNINESALKREADSGKNLRKLSQMAIRLLDALYEDANEALLINKEGEEAFDEVLNHDENTRLVNGIQDDNPIIAEILDKNHIQSIIGDSRNVFNNFDDTTKKNSLSNSRKKKNIA